MRMYDASKAGATCMELLVFYAAQCWVCFGISEELASVFRPGFSETSMRTHFTTRCKRTGITIYDIMYDGIGTTTMSAENATRRGHVNLGLYTAGLKLCN